MENSINKGESLTSWDPKFFYGIYMLVVYGVDPCPKYECDVKEGKSTEIYLSTIHVNLAM